MNFTLISTGLPKNLNLHGYYPLMGTKVLKDHGGNALVVMKYSTLLHFAHATHVIRSQDIAEIVSYRSLGSRSSPGM